jgi:2-oxoglutarate ferredoxin oxidoreductase subunit alpha
MFRPTTLYPFPSARLHDLVWRSSSVLVVELSTGQLVEDVRLAVDARVPVQHFGRTGGMIPSAEDVLQVLAKMELECVENYT